MPVAPANLKRILGTPTVWLIGMGVAIGSGIFRTPGEIAGGVSSPVIMLIVWIAAGGIVLAQGLVTAELATRFPRAGGEYVYLREAYGEFVAFFFGWAYTVFIIGGGAAAIAVALGDFACRLFEIPAERFGGPIAAGAVLAVTCVNACGLRVGAGAQNALTMLKILALIAIIVIGLGWGREPTHWLGGDPAASAATETNGGFSEPRASARAESAAVQSPDAQSDSRSGAMVGHSHESGPRAEPTLAGAGESARAEARGSLAAIALFLSALLPALWAYDGTTDSVKMAEEVRDVRRAMPRAIIGATLSLVMLYTLVNVALLRVLPLSELRGEVSAPGAAMRRLFGEAGGRAMLVVAIVVCLGSLSATVLATIRVTFALARDGLTFRFLSRMSAGQSPVAALFVVSGFSIVLCLVRDFSGVLNIYYFAGCILFGLSYASLLVFRRRDAATATDRAHDTGRAHDKDRANDTDRDVSTPSRPAADTPRNAATPAGHGRSAAEGVTVQAIFRCPAGRAIAVCLLVFQAALAANIARESPTDVGWSCAVLAGVGGLYWVWRRGRR